VVLAQNENDFSLYDSKAIIIIIILWPRGTKESGYAVFFHLHYSHSPTDGGESSIIRKSVRPMMPVNIDMDCVFRL
jgi:hypothetical protein